ncbi:Helicase [Dikerogammarus haemobaphes nudivirus]|nr:Helicase [Dikerogammarus haemobaphes nudivirus]
MTDLLNWNLIAKRANTILESEERVVKKPKLELNNMIAYKTIHSKQIIEKTNEFTEKIFNTSSYNSYNFQVIDNIQNKKYKGNYNLGVTLNDFKIFEETGHALAFNFTSSYITPLMFDLDCLHCKQSNCTSPISNEIVNTIVFENITQTIANVLRVPIDDVCKNTVIFKKDTKCNLHVYTSYSTSIIFYELIRPMVESRFTGDLQERYCVDNISTLDLPYSTKCGEEIYKPTIDLKEKNNIIITPVLPFFEIPIKLNTRFQFSQSFVLGEFTRISQNTDWYDESVNVIFLTTPINIPEVYTTSIFNTSIENIKISQAKFKTSHKLLDLYFNVSEKTENVFLDATILSELGTSELELTVQNTLLSLAERIAKLVFKELHPSKDHLFNYLLKFITIEDCGYTFYIIMAIIFYVIKTNSNYTKIDFECYKIAILTVLQHISNFSNDGLFNVILKNIQNFRICVRLENIFKDPISWFIEIAKKIEYSKYDNYTNFLLSRLTVYETFDSVEQELLKLCALELPLIRNGAESNLFYYYSKGQYIEIRENILLGINQNLKIRHLTHTLMNFKNRLEAEFQISTELAEQFTPNVIKEVWYKYLNSSIIPIKKPLMNLYDYFINTEIGIFNTITGLYMNYIPLLYMNAQKAYCTIPTNIPINNLPMNLINKYISMEYPKNEEVLEKIIEKQTALYYLSVMVPGLLTLPDVIYSTIDQTEIIEKTTLIIIDDPSLENERELYYLLPVIIHYKFSIAKLVYMSQFIDKLSSFTIVDLERVLKNTTSKFDETLEEFDYNPIIAQGSKALYNTLNTKEHPLNTKGFAMIVIFCILDFCDDELLQTVFNGSLYDERITCPEIYKTFPPSENFRLGSNNITNYYTNKTNINFKRALHIILPKYNNFTESFVNIMYSLSHTFNFNSFALDDFLYFASMIYYPGSERKRILLMIGSQSCGKTTIQDAFYWMQPQATFSIDSVVQGNSGPAPELIKVYNSYLFNIVELKTISPDIMKTLTGGDLQYKRQLYQNEYREMKPLAFTIAASNSIPLIPGADEAIKVRLAPFSMNCKYDNLVKYEDNALLLNIKNVLIKSPTFNIQEFSIEFSNLLYTQFSLKRDEESLITPVINEQNLTSKKLLNECLCRNNYIYNFLDRSNIIFDPTLCISAKKLKRVITKALEEYNESTPKKKLTFAYVKRNMDTLFVNYLNANQDGYNGFGILENKNEKSDEIFELVSTPNENCKIVKIKNFLLSNNYSMYDIKAKIKEVIEEYNDFYDPINKIIINHKLIKKTMIKEVELSIVSDDEE